MKKIRKSLDNEVNSRVSYLDLWYYIDKYDLEIVGSGDGIDYVYESDKIGFNKYLRFELNI